MNFDFRNVTDLTLNGQALTKLQIGSKVVWEKQQEPTYEGMIIEFTTTTSQTVYYRHNGRFVIDGVEKISTGPSGSATTPNSMTLDAGSHLMKIPSATTLYGSYSYSYESGGSRPNYYSYTINYGSPLGTLYDYGSWSEYDRGYYSYRYYNSGSTPYFPATTVIVSGDRILDKAFWGYGYVSKSASSSTTYTGNLVTAAIKPSVKTIGQRAFYKQHNLKELFLQSDLPVPPILQSNSFEESGIEDGYTTIYVHKKPDHSILNAYKNANNWSKYGDLMVEI